jgi:hypothetical protein
MPATVGRRDKECGRDGGHPSKLGAVERCKECVGRMPARSAERARKMPPTVWPRYGTRSSMPAPPRIFKSPVRAARVISPAGADRPACSMLTAVMP